MLEDQVAERSGLEVWRLRRVASEGGDGSSHGCDTAADRVLFAFEIELYRLLFAQSSHCLCRGGWRGNLSGVRGWSDMVGGCRVWDGSGSPLMNNCRVALPLHLHGRVHHAIGGCDRARAGLVSRARPGSCL